MRLFVYGTLMQGEVAHALLAERARFIGPATASGYALFDLGPYPAMVRGEGVVVGEIYEIDEISLPELDAYEGEGFGRARLATGEVAYLATSAPRGPRIASGDWRRR